MISAPPKRINGRDTGGEGSHGGLPADCIHPVGKPFFIKRVTDHYSKGRVRADGNTLVRRTVDSSLVQYFEVIQNVGDRLSDSDGSPCSLSNHEVTYDTAKPASFAENINPNGKFLQKARRQRDC